MDFNNEFGGILKIDFLKFFAWTGAALISLACWIGFGIGVWLIFSLHGCSKSGLLTCVNNGRVVDCRDF